MVYLLKNATFGLDMRMDAPRNCARTGTKGAVHTCLTKKESSHVNNHQEG